MLEPSIVDEWMAAGWAKGWEKGWAKGMVLGRRDNLMRVLQFRFPAQVPSDVETAIQAQNDLDTLSQWFDAALRATSLDEFRAVVSRQA